MTNEVLKRWGFYGGIVEFDGRGYCVKLHESAGEIYLECNEAKSLVSLLWKILFKKNIKHD